MHWEGICPDCLLVFSVGLSRVLSGRPTGMQGREDLLMRECLQTSARVGRIGCL